jgi:hypothetical protein
MLSEKVVNMVQAADTENVKRLLVAAMLCCSAGCWTEPGRLPVLSVRYEVAEGTDEDEDQGDLEPTFLRHTAAFKATEEFTDRLRAELQVRYSRKDYFDGESDYSYLALDPAVRLQLGQRLGLALGLETKGVLFDELDTLGGSKDYLAVGGRLEADWKASPAVRLEAALRGVFDLHRNPAGSRQAYTLGLAAISRLGPLSLGARYRAVSRLPLGSESLEGVSFYQVGIISASWDLNR